MSRSPQQRYERSWWDCPICGNATEIHVGPETGCERHCRSCDWEITLTDCVTGYKLHPYDNWHTNE